MTLKVIDTSNNNKGVPDATIGVDAIIFKLTEGGAQVDTDFQASYNEARGAGKLVGAYDFARPDLNGAIDEANAFVDNLNRHGANNDDTVIVLDWEHTPTNDTNWAKQFADQVYNLTGKRLLFYMNLSTANSYDWSNVWHDYALWVARYWDMSPDVNFDMTNAGPAPDVKWPYGYAMWQWTSVGRLNGYGGNLDCSIFYGDANSWKAFARSRPTETTTTATAAPTTTTTTSIPVTTTTTTESPVETATTTTTEDSHETTTSTTTTQAGETSPPAATGSSFWEQIVAILLAIFKRIRS